MNIIGSTIISFSNGKQGTQPAILVQAPNGKRYLIVSTPERKFQVSESLSNRIE